MKIKEFWEQKIIEHKIITTAFMALTLVISSPAFAQDGHEGHDDDVHSDADHHDGDAEANGEDMDGKSQSEVVALLRNVKLGDTVHIEISRQVAEEDRFKVPRQLVNSILCCLSFVTFCCINIVFRLTYNKCYSESLLLCEKKNALLIKMA